MFSTSIFEHVGELTAAPKDTEIVNYKLAFVDLDQLTPPLHGYLKFILLHLSSRFKTLA